MSHKEITKQSYQTTAKEYAANVANLAPTGSINKLISLLPVHPKLLDIGCGSGRDAALFIAHGAKAVGIDFSANMLEIAEFCFYRFTPSLLTAILVQGTR